MASQSLYRKWRSQTFAEIVGQQRVTRTLQNALRTGRLSHAYLFCGPRGVGKTSAARVLAKAVNCQQRLDTEPCNACPTCLSISEGRCMDIIEIDAASNRGIDEIRDLRDKVNFAPSEARYKFYILDEVHMLTSEAFNALLKTLEEPPNHAVFILVTTEAHRVPATIVSRCQRFDFQRIGLGDLISRLRFICQAEKIDIEDSAVELIGRLSTGSLRDAESLLDQLVSYCGNRITLDDVHTLVGMTGTTAAKELAAYLIAGDIPSGLRLINQVINDGIDARQFCREIVEYLRGLLVVKIGASAELLDTTRDRLDEMKRLAQNTSPEFLVRSIRLFVNAEIAQRSPLHIQLPLELAFLEATLPSAVQSESAPALSRTSGSQPRPEKTPVPSISIIEPQRERHTLSAGQPRNHSDQVRGGPEDAGADDAKSEEHVTSGSAANREEGARGPADQFQRLWERMIERCGQIDKKVQAILRDSEIIDLDGDLVHLEFRFPFHRQQIDDPRNSTIVESVLAGILGKQVRIKSSLRPKEKEKSRSWRSPVEDPLVKAAIEFGARIKKVEIAREETSEG